MSGKYVPVIRCKFLAGCFPGLQKIFAPHHAFSYHVPHYGRLPANCLSNKCGRTNSRNASSGLWVCLGLLCTLRELSKPYGPTGTLCIHVIFCQVARSGPFIACLFLSRKV